MEPFIAPDQLLIEMLWNVLLVLTICAVGMVASLALLVFASWATERASGTLSEREVRGV